MRYYAIADLHGRFDLLKKAWEAIEEDASKADKITAYTIITLGDYIDRGPQSKEIIDFLIKEEVVSLMGNHEAMAVESITKLPDISWWVGNGGDATLKSYNHSDFTFGKHYEILLQQGVVPDEHVKWMANLPIYYETKKQLFVHAGVPQSEMNLPPKKAHHYQDMMWMLYSKNDGRGWKDKHVVHGHHQFADGPHEWSGRTDLDTFAWWTGRLVIGVFDDTQGKAIRYIEVLGDDYGTKSE